MRPYYRISWILHRAMAMIRNYETDRRVRKSARIILGAGGTEYPDWVATDKNLLNVTRTRDFEKYWRPNSRTAFLAEHVWEHLDTLERCKANTNCFNFLKPSGWLRIAVPDGLHPDPGYIEYVRPGGSGLGATEHQVLFNHHSLVRELEAVGFQVSLLEYWNEAGKFIHQEWRTEDGYIYRSIRFDQRNLDGIPRYTSLIVDARKPR